MKKLETIVPAPEWKGRPIMVHTSAVKAHDRKHQAQAIENYHRTSLGWKNCGYSYVIERDGTVYESAALHTAQCHCRHGGQNRLSLGVCLAGDGDNQEPTTAQIEALHEIFIIYDAPAMLYHCDFNPGKTCPGAAVKAALNKNNSLIAKYKKGA